MDKRTKVLIFAASANLLLSMMAMIIHSRKRKIVSRREGVKYDPMVERDRMRIEYLNTKIWRNDNMLRLRKDSFFRFCKLFRNRGLLEDTIHMSIEEQVTMFLNTAGHNLRNR
ncbi:hypothetical protein DAI22_03g104900 [Oryza sativa Japonica Group]|jgi:hypothetical protein|nr:hypothetical protein DAI22_03g104900 [Oryza sativa Japonica Group]